MGKQRKQWQTLFSSAPESLQMVTAAIKLKDACSLEEKAMTNLDSILKSRDITLPTKVHIVKAIVFPVLMYRCESWIIKKAPRFWTVVLVKILESPLDSKEIKSDNPKGNNPEYSLEGLLLKLKLQYFDHLMPRAISLEKTLMLGRSKAKGEMVSREWVG